MSFISSKVANIYSILLWFSYPSIFFFIFFILMIIWLIWKQYHLRIFYYLSPFDETVPSLMQWDASPDRGRKRPCICSPWLGSGVLVTHKKSHVGCVSKADASSLCPKSELEWEPSGMCGLSGEAWSVYLLFDHRAVHSVFYIVFLRLR